MSSVVEEQQSSDVALQQAEPPAKRRRGGRRASNPDISTEERKRLRVLKNRESAMRSLAKKAEYSARLERMQKDAEEQYNQTQDQLEKILSAALSLRTLVNKIPEDQSKLLSEVEAAIKRSTEVLGTDSLSPEIGHASSLLTSAAIPHLGNTES